jgi:hypothetical protein
MKAWMSAVAVGSLAAAGIGFVASGLEGAYVTPTGTKATIGADSVHVEIPDGPPAFDVPYVIEGDTFTFNASPDDPTCPGLVGVYTFVETETDLTFTAVADDCEAREADVTAGAWMKSE